MRVDRNQADRCRRSTSSATRCKREAPFPLSNAKVLGPLIIEYGTRKPCERCFQRCAEAILSSCSASRNPKPAPTSRTLLPALFARAMVTAKSCTITRSPATSWSRRTSRPRCAHPPGHVRPACLYHLGRLQQHRKSNPRWVERWRDQSLDLDRLGGIPYSHFPTLFTPTSQRSSGWSLTTPRRT